MLNKVEVRNAKGDLLSLPFEDMSNGYCVKGIDGLGPVKAAIVKSSFAQLDGTQYHSSSLGDRNITMKLGLYPNWISNDVEDLRYALYDYLMPKSPISLRFYTDKGLTVDIAGRVESLEPDIFSREPAVDASIICFQPDFLALAEISISGNTVSDTTATTISYAGTSEAGIILALNINRTLGEFTIYNQAADGTLQALDFQTSLAAGDVLTINTNVGSRGATLVRGGTISQPLYAIQKPTGWTSLQKGDNLIRVYATGAAIPYTISYTTRYGGL